MQILQLILNLAVIVLPLIFRDNSIYNEGLVKLNELLIRKRKEFEGMSNEEKSVALSNLVTDLHTLLELRK